jgi:hypothetical protein
MNLTGDTNTPALPMTEAEVNHLRRLLAWMRCEWTLDEDMQRGYLQGASAAVQYGSATPEQASVIVAEKAAHINRSLRAAGSEDVDQGAARPRARGRDC